MFRENTRLLLCRERPAKATASILFLFLPFFCMGQSPLRLQHISVKEGLSQNSVNCVLQDRYGFIWLATGDGLNRYDGKEVLTYKSRFTDTPSTYLLDRNINSKLAEDNHGRIWMATDAGISYLDYRHSRFKVVVGRIIGTAVLLGMQKDILWAAVPRRGFCAVNTKDLSYKLFPFCDKFQNDSSHAYPVYNAQLTTSGIWMADGKGLVYFDFNTLKDTRVLARENVHNTCKIGDKILLTADNGVHIYDPVLKKAKFLPIQTEPGSGQLQWTHCVDDNKNGAYVCSNNGLIAKLDQTGNYTLLRFQNSSVNNLFIDNSENLWVGTEGDGVYKLDIKQAKFKSLAPFNQNDITNGFMVKSIYQDAGRILIGTADKGLWAYNTKSGNVKNVPLPVPLAGKQVGAIIRDSSGRLVVAAASSIFWLDDQTLQVKKRVELPQITFSSFTLPVIYCLDEWKKDHFLVGTNIGIYSVKIENGKASAYFPWSITNLNWGGWIYGFRKQPDGTLYVGKRNGFSKLRVINDTALQLLERNLDKLVIRHFYKSVNTPILWLASEVGLIAYNELTRKVQVFDERSGLGNSNTYAILPETDSTLWVSSNRGISSVSVHYADLLHLKIDVTNYSSKDGLQSDEFNTGAYYKGSDGSMIFGGISGINWFNPKDIRRNPHIAVPAISAVYINDTLFAGDTANYLRTLILPYNKNTISFNLRALEYTQPEENMFAYRLAGVDKDWVYTTNDKARYSNLAPGVYTFLLKARNNEAVWNHQPFVMQITIRPPYWQTWWFRLFAALLCIAIAAIVITYFIRRRVRVRTLQLEQQQALNMERLRISKDVHDDLGAGLSKISLMAEMVQKQVIGDLAVGNGIRHISSVSKDLIDNMHDLIWVLNPENTTLDNLVARIREYSADYLDGLNIQACLDFPDDVPEISITREAQRNIFSTVKEAVSNCIRHAQASHIKISVKLEHNLFEICIEDNGCGVNNNKQRQGNGLRNMKQRIEAIGGHLTISSEAAKGTAVCIALPVTRLQHV